MLLLRGTEYTCPVYRTHSSWRSRNIWLASDLQQTPTRSKVSPSYSLFTPFSSVPAYRLLCNCGTVLKCQGWLCRGLICSCPRTMCTAKLKSKFTASECLLPNLLAIPLCSWCIQLLICFLRGDMVILLFYWSCWVVHGVLNEEIDRNFLCSDSCTFFSSCNRYQ